MKPLIALASFLFINCLSTLYAKETPQGKGPVINEDKSVTFRIEIPGYDDDITLRGSFLDNKGFLNTITGKSGKGKGSVDMEELGDGIFSYSSSPLVSDLYTYNYFDEDDKIILDPDNPNVMRDVDTYLNYFIVPGGLGDLFDYKQVPHGTLTHVWYPSDLTGMAKRRMSVYLPPQYKFEKHLCFPVLYLMHGSGGDEDSWTECGKAVNVLDNMIAQAKCEPMIVVMPNGNVKLAAAPGEDPANPDIKPTSNNIASMFGGIESVFMHDVVEYIDSHYRTIPKADSRAIAGLSLGGLHALYISLNYPDKFDYIGLFSAQTSNALNDKRIGEIKEMGISWDKLKDKFSFLGGSKIDRAIETVDNPHLEIYEDFDSKLDALYSYNPTEIYIAHGKDDFVKKLNDDLRNKLDAKNYPYTFNLSDGGHSWENWRHYLIDFLPRLFR